MLSAHQLNVFLVAADTLNFTQAAQMLEMSQPSVSQHIQALEEHFGVSLFFRSGRSLELTEAGEKLVPLARNFTHLSNHIEETMVSAKSEVSGHLMVGCGTTVGKYFMPQMLSGFHRLYPLVRTTCHSTSQVKALQKLSEGKIHLSITTYSEQSLDIEFQKLLTDEILLIAPFNHPWSVAGYANPQDLYDAEFILPEEGSECHIAVREALSTVGISIYQLRSTMILGSAEAIGLAVQEGLGLGFVSRMVVGKLIHQGVCPVRVPGLVVNQDIYLGRHTNRLPTSAQAAFWDYVFDQENPVLVEMNLLQNL